MLKAHEEEKVKPFQVKATKREKEAMQANANRFTRGNLSKWVRYAAMNYRPLPSEIIETTSEENAQKLSRDM